MPTPKPGKETQEEWMHRCVPRVLNDGTASTDKQAVAICESMWREATKPKGAEKMRKTLNFKFEVKASLNSREFEGYGSTFGNVDLGQDVLMPGAFDETLADHEKSDTLPQMYWMHNMDQVPGMWTTMAPDKNGLYCKGVTADTPLGNEVRTLLNMKAVRGLSIGFSVPDYSKDISYTEDGVRMIHKVDLWEVSVVSLAMNPLAQVTASKARLSMTGEYVPTAREFEKDLKAKGYSGRIACAITAKVFDGDPSGILAGLQGDPEDVDEAAAEELLKMIQSTTTSMVRGAFR